jgi:pimeloyl-ACP methyl ester carboxylesterase
VPDVRVQAAIDNWAPRFIAMGVDYNDFVRTTARIERWEEWLPEWGATAELHMELAREAEERGAALSAGEAYVRAAVCFHFSKFVWVLDDGLHREHTRRSIDALARAHQLLDPRAERVEVPLDGATMAANLRRPDGVERPPLVVLIPGLDSTKEEFFHWENVFLRRGMATISMDGPGQGETGFELPIRGDYEVAVTALLDGIAGRSDVDLDSLGALGVSLGGYYAPRAAAFERRIKAVAGISGPYRFADRWENLPPITRETYVYKSKVADEAEVLERLATLDMSGVAERLTQPTLIVTGKLDRLVPWEQTKRIADEAPGGRFVLYEEGSHVCNNMPYRYRPLVADWMLGQLHRGGEIADCRLQIAGG